MKKMSSCHRDMSKLSESYNKVLGLTQVNFYFNAGSTLPRRDNIMLRKCIISSSNLGLKRRDSGLSIFTCTEKSLILLSEFVFLTLDFIIIKYGNLGRHCTSSLIFFKHSYLNVFHISNILLNLKCLCSVKVCNILDLHQIILRQRLGFQELICQNGGKKVEKANDLTNFRYTFCKLGNKLNSIYLNLNQKVSYRQYCAQDSSLDERLNITVQEWPSSKLLVKFKREVTQEQMTLVDLAKTKGLHSKAVKRQQTIFLRSLKFRIIAVYKVSQTNEAKTLGIDKVQFNSNSYEKKKKCWDVVELLRKIILKPEIWSTKRVWLTKIKYKEGFMVIPNIINRALQQLVCLVLDPLVEFTSDSNSFGFRKYKSAKMAIGVLKELLKTLDKNYIKPSFFVQSPQEVPTIPHEDKWILDENIRGFFENTNLRYLFDNLFLPVLGIFLVKNLLAANVTNKHVSVVSKNKTQQTRILLPTLINFTLNGLQNIVYQAIHLSTKSKSKQIKSLGTNIVYFSDLNIVRYLDNFVVLSRSKFVLKSLIIPKINKFLQERGLRLSSKEIKLFRLKDKVKLKFLGYIFHYEDKWKLKNKFTYTSHVKSRAIALYPNKSGLNNLIKKFKQTFKKSSNLDGYNLIKKLNPCLQAWGSYFNLENCARYRSLFKNLVYKMCWKWAQKKHKKWGKKKIAEFYFLTKQKIKNFDGKKKIELFNRKIHKKKQQFQKTNNFKWSFHGAVNSKLSKKNKTLHLYNTVKKGSIVSAILYKVPQNFRVIHAYHPNILKLIKWSVKTNQKVIK